jgi:hypothetical protein
MLEGEMLFEYDQHIFQMYLKQRRSRFTSRPPTPSQENGGFRNCTFKMANFVTGHGTGSALIAARAFE